MLACFHHSFKALDTSFAYRRSQEARYNRLHHTAEEQQSFLPGLHRIRGICRFLQRSIKSNQPNLRTIRLLRNRCRHRRRNSDLRRTGGFSSCFSICGSYEAVSSNDTVIGSVDSNWLCGAHLHARDSHGSRAVYHLRHFGGSLVFFAALRTGISG